jgi:hypothetical protein
MKLNCFIHTWLFINRSTDITTLNTPIQMKRVPSPHAEGLGALYVHSGKARKKTRIRKEKGKDTEVFCLEPTTFFSGPTTFYSGPTTFSRDPRLFTHDPRLLASPLQNT